MMQVSNFLEFNDFSVVKSSDYRVYDERFKKKHFVINRIEINGHKQFVRWLEMIGTRYPKNFKRIKRWKQANINKS